MPGVPNKNGGTANYLLHGSNNVISISDNYNIAFGTGDFSIIYKGKPLDGQYNQDKFLFNKYQDNDNRITFFNSSGGNLGFLVKVGASTYANYSSSGINWTDKESVFAFVSDRDGVKGQLYKNGVPLSTTETTVMNTLSLNNTGDVTIW